MKAVILAGGSGTRGKPYTDYIPKAMFPVGNRPLIDYILDHVCASDVIDGVIIISDFEGLGGQIKNYLEDSRRKKGITLVQDSQSGTGGDLLHAQQALEGSQEFLLWFVDNLCALDISAMLSHFQEKGGLACIATRTSRREETGFADVADGMVRSFSEKPTVRLPMAECLGIYILSTGILPMIRQVQGSVNLSYDILQGLAQRGGVSAYNTDEDWMDVGSPATLERNASLASGIIRRMVA